MQLITQTFDTKNGKVEGICVKWPGFSILTVTGTKGFLACPAIDVDACENYSAAAAIIESGPDNPIGTLDNFCTRKVTKANKKANQLGIIEGMVAQDAFELIA